MNHPKIMVTSSIAFLIWKCSWDAKTHTYLNTTYVRTPTKVIVSEMKVCSIVLGKWKANKWKQIWDGLKLSYRNGLSLILPILLDRQADEDVEGDASTTVIDRWTWWRVVSCRVVSCWIKLHCIAFLSIDMYGWARLHKINWRKTLCSSFPSQNVLVYSTSS